jgi:hypothetical protein
LEDEGKRFHTYSHGVDTHLPLGVAAAGLDKRPRNLKMSLTIDWPMIDLNKATDLLRFHLILHY